MKLSEGADLTHLLALVQDQGIGNAANRPRVGAIIPEILGVNSQRQSSGVLIGSEVPVGGEPGAYGLPVDVDEGADVGAGAGRRRRRERVRQVAEQTKYRGGPFRAFAVVLEGETELPLGDVLVGVPENVAGSGGVGIREVFGLGQGSRIFGLRGVRVTEAKRSRRAGTEDVVGAEVELGEVRGAVLPESVILGVRDATRCRSPSRSGRRFGSRPSSSRTIRLLPVRSH